MQIYVLVTLILHCCNGSNEDGKRRAILKTEPSDTFDVTEDANVRAVVQKTLLGAVLEKIAYPLRRRLTFLIPHLFIVCSRRHVARALSYNLEKSKDILSTG